MKRAVPLVVVALLFGGCAGTPTQPEAVDDCNGLAKIGAVLVEDYLRAVSGLPLAVVRGDEAAPPEIVALDARGAALDLRASELGCDPAELNRAIVERTSELTSDDLAGSLFLDLVRAAATPTTTDVTDP